jgi:hypothetical protein
MAVHTTLLGNPRQRWIHLLPFVLLSIIVVIVVIVGIVVIGVVVASIMLGVAPHALPHALDRLLIGIRCLVLA